MNTFCRVGDKLVFSRSIFAVLLVVGACSETTPPQKQTPIQLPVTGRIVFQSTRLDSLRDIWMMSSDGGDLRRLTDTATRDLCPSLSPDGNWIAIHQLSRSAAKAQVFPARQDSLVVMRADGTAPVARANLEVYATYGAFCPQWSAGSDRILTASATEEPRVRSNQNFRVRLLDKSGTALSLYNVGDLGVTLRGISLSPDGTRFLASVANNSTAGPPSGFRVYNMRIDGTDRQLIGDGGDATWSPTGTAIAWNCFGVCVSGVSGAGAKTIYSETTFGLPYTNTIRFSPDGAFVAFGCGLSGNTHRSLCIGEIATNLVEEVPIGRVVGRITWMGDNNTVAFECQFDNNEICVTTRGSKTFRNVTNNIADDANPSAR